MVLTLKPYSTVVRWNSCLHCIMQKLSVCSGCLFVCSAHQCTNTKKGNGIVIILIHRICVQYCPRHIHFKTPDQFLHLCYARCEQRAAAEAPSASTHGPSSVWFVTTFCAVANNGIISTYIPAG